MKLRNDFPKNSIIITDPPYNINYKYPEYFDKMNKDKYMVMISSLRMFPTVFIHYPEHIINCICPALGKYPQEIVSWVYNSNTPKQHRLIAWFNCSPDLSKVKQPYKNLSDKRIQERIQKGSKSTDLYDWWKIDLVKNVSNEKEDYTNQIPEKIIERIIKTTVSKDQIIVDPFCGTGTTCTVAEKLGYDWIGIDVSKKAVKIAQKRISIVKRKLNIFKVD